MYIATTPTHIFTLPFDTSNCSKIQVTYTQGDMQLVKQYQDGILPDGMTLDEKDINIFLTQEETLQFRKGSAIVRVRVKTATDKVMASQKMGFQVYDVENKEVL